MLIQQIDSIKSYLTYMPIVRSLDPAQGRNQNGTKCIFKTPS